MIIKYNEFLLERLISAINESEIVYSSNFVKMLRKIDSPLSRVILDAQDQDKDVISNFFDIDTKETISFVSDKKAQELLKSEIKYYTLQNKENQYSSNLTNSFIEKLASVLGMSVGDTNVLIQTKLGYDPKEKEYGQKVGEFDYYGNYCTILKFGEAYVITDTFNVIKKEAPWVKNRQPIKIGRAIRALLNSLDYKFKDEEIEDFVNQWKSSFDWFNDAFRNFELVSGDSIAYYYYYDNYLKGRGRGTLGSSCMANKPKYYFEIYTENPEVCSLLILRSENDPTKIVGRALVWKLRPTTEDETEGNIFMDRIYTHETSDVDLFRKYAKEKGWWYKKTNDSDAYSSVVKPDKEEYCLLQVSIKSKDYTSYPYVDTIKYLTEFKDQIILSNEEENSDWILEETSGGRSSPNCQTCGGENWVDCYSCEGSGEETNDCRFCDGNGKNQCEECDGEGEKDCGECDGEGKKDCEECDGDGDIDGEKCDECNGEGKKDCDGCNGKGKVDCDECTRGNIECEDCNGSGEVTGECGECGGVGRIRCPDCY